MRDGVMIVEVAPRDGLQNEPCVVPTRDKIAFVEALVDAGLRSVEVTSFVSPRAVPGLADADDVLRAIQRRPGVEYPVLVPNERGLDRALAAGATEIALFTAATDRFSEANVGTSIDGTFHRFAPVARRAHELGITMRGYLSVAFVCPYAGPVAPSAVVEQTDRLLALGCEQVSLADTIGAATPEMTSRALVETTRRIPPAKLALHFHDTGGRALANVEAGLEHGIRTFDAAAGGLGGCPFAPGAPGNLATESLVAYFDERGIETAVDRVAVASAVKDLRAVIAKGPVVDGSAEVVTETRLDQHR